MSYPILYSKNEYKRLPAIAGSAVAGQSIVGSTSSLENPFESRGLGTLSDCISCTVTEERNGSYELEMQYSINGIHFEDIQQRYFIMAKPNYLDDPQPFRIYKITKPLNKICTIYARHISYDLSGFEVPAGISMPSAPLALAKLDEYANGFNIGGQVGGTAEFKTDVPSSVRSWFGGKEGSLIDLYGGEWHYDGTDCQLMANRGADRGVTIYYGKNLTSLTQDEECSNVYSHVRAYWQSGDSSVYVSNLVTTGIVFQPTRVFFLDCSGDFQEPPSVADLNAKAVAYIRANNMSAPRVNLSLDYVQMSAFDRVDLCDIVTVGFGELGVFAKAKCIKTKWNVLTDRYDEITLGDAKTSFADTVADISTKVTDVAVKRTTNILTEAIDHATEMITGNLGGYVVLHDSDEDGQPDEILIMDQPSIEDAVNIWRWNKSGLGFSSTGYNGTFGLAMTADGRIVADYITAGTMSANYVSGGTLQGVNVVAGGLDNSRGTFYVFDEDGNQLGSFSKDGVVIGQGSLASNTMRIWMEEYGNHGLYGCISQTGNNIILFTSSASANAAGVAMDTHSAGQGKIGIPSISSTNGTEWYSVLDSDSLVFNDDQNNLDTVRAKYGYDFYLRASATSSNLLRGYISGNTGNLRLNRSADNAYVIHSGGKSLYYNASGTMLVQIDSTNGVSANHLYVNGGKSRVVDTEDYAQRRLYCLETPSPMFADVGEGVIGDDGLCYVWIESIFAETIATDQYQVFIQKYGDGDCWIRERKTGYFVVEGTPDLVFGWELKAKQIDFTQNRLDKHDLWHIDTSNTFGIDGADHVIEMQVNYGDYAVDYLSELKGGRIA